jgi:hypothetical protein
VSLASGLILPECHRLKEECRSSATGRRHNPKKTVVFKTPRLEEKLHHLVSLFRAGAQSTAIAADTHATATRYDFEYHINIPINSTTSPDGQVEGSLVNNVSNGYLPNPVVFIPGTSAVESTTCPSLASVSDCAFEPKSLEAEEYLTIFHTQKLKYFPFLFIPSNTST